MDGTPLGTLQRVDLRDQWQDEARDFTPWLAGHIALLGETLGLELEVEAQEKEVGPYNADILCRDTSSTSDNAVLVENQLEKTDHVHLGQLLTYAAGLQTVTVVWIARDFTEQHRAALDWLNDITDARFKFFGLEIELWQIGNSPVAPKLNIVAKPNDWVRGVRESARTELTEAKQLQLNFWRAFSEHLAANSRLKGTKPLPQHWMGHAVGRSGFGLTTICSTWSDESVETGEVRVELLIDGADADAHYRLLAARREEIESSLAGALAWHRRDDTRQRKVYARRDADVANEDNWPEYFAWLQDRLEAFDSVFRPLVGSLNAADAPPMSMDDEDVEPEPSAG